MTDTLEVHVSVARRSFEVRADLVAGPGERIALFGPSGAGKTTLLEAIAGLAEPSAGAVRLGETVLSQEAVRPGRRRRLAHRMAPAGPTSAAVQHVSLLRQPARLFPHLDVESNVCYGHATPSTAAEMIERLDLTELRDARPVALSAGQAQRVALARALSRPFSVLLLDEPMTAMDAASKANAWAAVRDRCLEEHATSLLVTHDVREAQGFGDRLAVMDEGEILTVGSPHEVVSAPVSRRVAEVVGYVTFLRLKQVGTGAPLCDNDEIEVAIDPLRIRLGSHPGDGIVFQAVVSGCRPAGSGFELDATIRLRAPLSAPFAGKWVSAVTCDLQVQVDAPVTMGKEILATSLSPPVVAGHTQKGGEP